MNAVGIEYLSVATSKRDGVKNEWVMDDYVLNSKVSDQYEKKIHWSDLDMQRVNEDWITKQIYEEQTNDLRGRGRPRKLWLGGADEAEVQKAIYESVYGRGRGGFQG